MKKLVAILVLTILFEVVPIQADRGLQLKKMKEEQRVALVIGNNEYNSDRLSALRNPINDAKAIKDKLQILGFKVYYGENLTVREMDKKLRTFSSKLKSGGVGLFFFAGHGVESQGANYLMGKDSKLLDKEDIAYESLELNKVLDKMKNSGNRLNIVLLDACRSDPFSRSGGGGLAKVDNAKGMFIAYATSPGDVASDGNGDAKHGVFTQEILNNIDAQGIPLHNLFKNVKRDVYNKTNQRQRPWTHDDIIGDFFFILPNQSQSAPTLNKQQIIKNTPIVTNRQEGIKTYKSNEQQSIDNFINFYSVDGNKDNQFMKMISSISLTGFKLSDPHEHIESGFLTKYGYTKLDNMGIFSMSNDDGLKNLLERYPSLGAFSLVNMFLYKKKSENKTIFGHIKPEVILDFVGIQNYADRNTFISMFKPLKNQISDQMNTQIHDTNAASFSKPSIMTYEFDINGDPIDFLDSFLEKFESLLESKKYILAGFRDYKEIYEDKKLDFNYEAYVVYSILNFDFSYLLSQEEAKLTSIIPSQVYIYIKNNKLYVGVFKLDNWNNLLNFSDKRIVQYLKQYDKDMNDTLINLGSKRGLNDKKNIQTSSNISAKTMPIPKVNLRKRFGESALFKTNYLNADTAINRLKENGFNILGQTTVGNDNSVVIIFTHDRLKNLAQEEGKGFLGGVLRLVIDNTRNEVYISNPKYFITAYMQKDFDDDSKYIHELLSKAFKNLSPVNEYINESDLKSYHYMIGMPYYKENIIVAEGDHDYLINKFRKTSKNKLVFEYKISNNITLFGIYRKNRSTDRYLSLEGNKMVFPYMVLIENNKAKIIAPKYQIPLYNPAMSMNQFVEFLTPLLSITKEIEFFFK